MSEKAILSLKNLTRSPEGLSGGHRLCAGCAESIIVRQTILASQPTPCVVANATGCLEVATSIYPYTAWNVPWVHAAFENAAAVISGVESAYKVFQKKNGMGPVNFIAFAGDGGTYDIGLQALSGAWERGHRFLFICLNNEGYMNTGVQRSSATPIGANTTTSPVGSGSAGKLQWRKNLSLIASAHRIPYIAQTLPWGGRQMDLATKVRKALACNGPAFINTLSPCNLGWKNDPDQLMRITEAAVETCYWPLYEVIEGKWILNYRPKNKRPVMDFLKLQGRFKHLQKPEYQPVVEEIQKRVDGEWEELLKLCQPPSPN